MNYNILKATMSILLIVVIYTNTKAQNNTSFLKDYYNTSIFGQYTVEKAGNVFKEDPNINYSIDSYVVQQIGLTYNVYQYKNWNFKTGLIYKYKYIKETFLWKTSQTGLDYNLGYTTRFDSSSKMYAIPLITEYIIPISNRIKLEVAPSITLAYFTGQEGGGVHIHGLKPNPATMLVYFDGYNKNPFFTSIELSTGFYILFKYFMLQPEFRYSKSFRDVLTGHYTVENFKTEPHNSKGTFTQSGDYWGFSLSIYIKRGKNKKSKFLKYL